jgi:hypothetical protein
MKDGVGDIHTFPQDVRNEQKCNEYIDQKNIDEDVRVVSFYKKKNRIELHHDQLTLQRLANRPHHRSRTMISITRCEHTGPNQAAKNKDHASRPKY